MTTRTPKVGEELLLCGFRASAPAFPITKGTPIETTGRVRISLGKVTERYPKGRDSSMIPWPVVEVECPAFGGMSGGPVFDSDGSLIGLVCSSIEISENEGVSYVSLLWPAMTAQFESTWLSGMLPSPASLLELDRRICPIIRPEAIRRIPLEDGKRCLTEYSEWEE